MFTLQAQAIILVALAIGFDFLNGFHDSSNIVATMIASRTLSYRWALLLAATAEFVAPFIFGVAVAETIGKGLVEPASVSANIIASALVGAILWNLITWYLGLPSSSSHALLGGIMGPVLVASGPQGIQISGLTKIVLALLISPPLGLIAGYLFMKFVLLLCHAASPKVSQLFKRLQVLVALMLALSHGTNDAQKSMGIIAMTLVTLGMQSSFVIPTWAILACATAIALGTGLGGSRIIRTVGMRIFRVRPVHGFASQAVSAGVILGAALLGGPVSTTQVVSSAIMGVGAAERLSRVRWGVAGNIMVTWVITIPASALVAAGIYYILGR